MPERLEVAEARHQLLIALNKIQDDHHLSESEILFLLSERLTDRLANRMRQRQQRTTASHKSTDTED